MVYMTSTPSFGSFVGKPSRHTTLLEPLDARLCYVDIKRGTINRSYIFPIPEYLFDVQQAGNRNLWKKNGTAKCREKQILVVASLLEEVEKNDLDWEN